MFQGKSENQPTEKQTNNYPSFKELIKLVYAYRNYRFTSLKASTLRTQMLARNRNNESCKHLVEEGKKTTKTTRPVIRIFSVN